MNLIGNVHLRNCNYGSLLHRKDVDRGNKLTRSVKNDKFRWNLKYYNIFKLQRKVFIITSRIHIYELICHAVARTRVVVVDYLFILCTHFKYYLLDHQTVPQNPNAKNNFYQKFLQSTRIYKHNRSVISNGFSLLLTQICASTFHKCIYFFRLQNAPYI